MTRPRPSTMHAQSGETPWCRRFGGRSYGRWRRNEPLVADGGGGMLARAWRKEGGDAEGGRGRGVQTGSEQARGRVEGPGVGSEVVGRIFQGKEGF